MGGVRAINRAVCFSSLIQTKALNDEFVEMKFIFSIQAIFFNSPPFCTIQVSKYSPQSPLQLSFTKFWNHWLYGEFDSALVLFIFSLFFSPISEFSSFNFCPILSLFPNSPQTAFSFSVFLPHSIIGQSNYFKHYPLFSFSLSTFQPIIIHHSFFFFSILIKN